MIRTLRALLVVIGMSILALTAPRDAFAQARPLTAPDIEAFLDGLIPIQQRRFDVAGTVVSVVKDGKVLFTKGYGYSDVYRRTAVTTDATLFRIGSISKTFTWTAVMQLVEQGKIDPDRDINSYLDFTIPAAFGKPVTMHHLLTHTAGFEENIKDMFVAGVPGSIGDYLKTHVPSRIYVPGTTPSYSNYGATLAGYIVERVSGTPFNEYIRQHIFQPLGMTRATFVQPLPDDLKSFMSQGYRLASEPPRKFEMIQVWPAGSVSATADAMSHFMIAQLEDGQYNGARVLKPETVRLMHSRLFGVSPAANGMAHGFYETTRNGHRTIAHGGDSQWFHSDMQLVLDEHLGFFISSNSAGNGGDLRAAVWTGLLDRYYPYVAPVAAPVTSALRDARSVAGAYQTSRRVETNVVSVLDLLSQDVVSVNADSTISSSSLKDLAGQPKRFREIAPLVFREVDGQAILAFTKDHEGKLVMSGDYPFMVGHQTPALKGSRLNIGALCFAVGVFFLTLLSWPIMAMLRKHYGTVPALSVRYRRLRLAIRITSLASLVFLVLIATLLTAIESDIASFSSNRAGYFHLVQATGVIGLLGLPVAVIYSLSSWRDRSLWVWTRVWNTLLPLAFVAHAGFLFNWHLFSM